MLSYLIHAVKCSGGKTCFVLFFLTWYQRSQGTSLRFLNFAQINRQNSRASAAFFLVFPPIRSWFRSLVFSCSWSKFVEFTLKQWRNLLRLPTYTEDNLPLYLHLHSLPVFRSISCLCVVRSCIVSNSQHWKLYMLPEPSSQPFVLSRFFWAFITPTHTPTPPPLPVLTCDSM